MTRDEYRRVVQRVIRDGIVMAIRGKHAGARDIEFIVEQLSGTLWTPHDPQTGAVTDVLHIPCEWYAGACRYRTDFQLPWVVLDVFRGSNMDAVSPVLADVLQECLEAGLREARVRDYARILQEQP